MRTNSKAYRENVLRMIIIESTLPSSQSGLVMDLLRRAYDAGSSAAKDVGEAGDVHAPDGTLMRGR